MFDVLREFRILREHTLPRLFYIRRVRLRTQLSTRVRPRNENRNFDLIAVLKKINAPFNHDAHDACSLCADQQIVRSHLMYFFASMAHRKEQAHYHANSRTFAVQNYKLLYWFVNKHGCAHTASKP